MALAMFNLVLMGVVLLFAEAQAAQTHASQVAAGGPGPQSPQDLARGRFLNFLTQSAAAGTAAAAPGATTSTFGVPAPVFSQQQVAAAAPATAGVAGSATADAAALPPVAPHLLPIYQQTLAFSGQNPVFGRAATDLIAHYQQQAATAAAVAPAINPAAAPIGVGL
ncbi:unnamed protein product [Meganyctiphanes norvegica]|uniref:Uncharacterized protein n=1 Tax=Meganyctiphanes norvegica TaxID=48144 RepID=A0AAV2S6V9_MEGNR